MTCSGSDRMIDDSLGTEWEGRTADSVDLD